MESNVYLLTMRWTDEIDRILQQQQNPIGEGSYAKVFKAKNLQNNDIVAVKQINISPLDNEAQLRQLQNLEEVENDHVVSHFQSIFDRSENVIYAMMELCNGSLRSQIQSSMQFTKEGIIKFIVQMVSAFLALQTKRIVHLDLKPENILVSFGHQSYYKICDFGCSEIAIKSLLRRYNSSFIGTFNYLAPQNYLFYQKGFPKSSADIWSLGVILYEIVHKKLPFPVDQTTKLILPTSVQQFFIGKTFIQYKDYPEEILNLIKLMLRAEPNSRINWAQLRDLLIAEYNIQQIQFLDIKQAMHKHKTILKIFIVVIVTIRKNIQFNPHLFWIDNRQRLCKCQIYLIHLSFLYNQKFLKLFSYKFIKLQTKVKQMFQRLSKLIVEQQKFVCKKMNLLQPNQGQLKKIQIDFIAEVGIIRQKLLLHTGCPWKSIKQLEFFFKQVINCFSMRKTFFACGDHQYFKQSLSQFDINY